MTEVVFYHLLRKPLERALPELLEKSAERGWRVVVQAASEERVEALDAHLWTYRDDNFLPHGTARDGETAAQQPILLTTADDNPNGATVRFLIDSTPLPVDAKSYERIVLLFDGEDEDAVATARVRWGEAKALGFEVTYWQPDEQGRWVKKA
jgi:DNA polymerase-3 subunit chi